MLDTGAGALMKLAEKCGCKAHVASGYCAVRICAAIYRRARRPAIAGDLKPVLSWKSRDCLVRTIERGRNRRLLRTFRATRRTRVACCLWAMPMD